VVDALPNCVQGHDVNLVADAHGEALNHGNSQRDANGHRDAETGLTVQSDAATHAFDVASHDVHPDAAARQATHLFAGAEPGSKGQLVDGGCVRCVGRKPERGRSFEEPCRIDTCAVIGDLDDHEIAVVARAKRDATERRLASVAPLLGRLDAMVDRIP